MDNFPQLSQSALFTRKAPGNTNRSFTSDQSCSFWFCTPLKDELESKS